MNWKIFQSLENTYKSNSPNLFGIDDALLIGAGTGLVGSVIGAFSNKSSTDSANRTNLQAVRETNQANLDLYREQYADQHKLWLENNAYNDPSAQMSRLRNAGLNPALMMQNGGANQAQAMSVPSANPMQAGHVEPSLFNVSDVGNVFAQMSSGLLNVQKAQGEQISNSFLAKIKQAELNQFIANTKLALQNTKKGSMEESYLKAQLTMANLQNKLFSETFDQQKQNFQLQNDMIGANISLARQQEAATKAQEALTNVQTKLAGMDLKYKPAMLESAIRQTVAQIGLLSANTSVSKNQAKLIYQQALSEKEVTTSKQNENELFDASWPYVLESLDLTNQKTASEMFRNRYESSGFKIGPLEFKTVDNPRTSENWQNWLKARTSNYRGHLR